MLVNVDGGGQLGERCGNVVWERPVLGYQNRSEYPSLARGKNDNQGDHSL